MFLRRYVLGAGPLFPVPPHAAVLGPAAYDLVSLLQDARLIVPSPTFTLVEVYETPRGSFWHFDLYRLEMPEQVFELGWEEALAEGISIIEWPERLGLLLPRHLSVTLEVDGDGRRALLDV